MYFRPELEFLLYKTIVEAGVRTLDFYKKANDIAYKDDNSPVTIADLESNRIIVRTLEKTKFPILSEESSQVDYNIRKNWKEFWMVDPLDGTKEFIRGGSDYTINIAFIKSYQTVFGLVYLPVKDILYIGDTESGAYKIENASKQIVLSHKELSKVRLNSRTWMPDNDTLLIVASKSHLNVSTERYINKLKNIYPKLEFKSFGSSLKLCILADGQADLYPRMGPTMEWDIAAGHAVLKAAGGEVISMKDKTPLCYNKNDLRNGEFIAFTKFTIDKPGFKDLD